MMETMNGEQLNMLLAKGYFTEMREVAPFFYLAVRAGNLNLALTMAEAMLKLGGWGLTPLYIAALKSQHASELGKFTAAQVSKKSLGDNIILPVHCACINPNKEILQSLIESLTDSFVLDEMRRKLSHYAAVCPNTSALEIILEKKIEIREGDSQKMTPLMLAAKFGRAGNVALLL
jgi:hypothetical protein